MRFTLENIFSPKAASGDRWPWFCWPFPVHTGLICWRVDPTAQVYHFSVRGLGVQWCQPSGNRRHPSSILSRHIGLNRVIQNLAPCSLSAWEALSVFTLLCIKAVHIHMVYRVQMLKEKCKVKSKSLLFNPFKDTVQWHQVHLCC